MSNRTVKQNFLSTPGIARIGILAALAIGLSFVEFPIFPAAPFYKVDPSLVPVMLCGYAMGPGAGLVCLLIKDVLGIFLHSNTGFVGMLADFIMSGTYMLLAVGVYYVWKKGRVTALLGMLVGTVAMALAAIPANLYILFPIYGYTAGTDFLLSITVPFNLIKGAIITAITFLIYKPLSPILKGTQRR